MTKTLQTIIATALITATLCSPVYSQRKRVGFRNLGEHAMNEVGDALGKSLAEGIVGGIANPGGIFGPQNMDSNPPKDDKDNSYYYMNRERQLQYKRKEEAHAFRYIINHINKPTEEGNLLKSIIENPQQYHNSLNPEELREFNEFWRKNKKSSVVFHNSYIPWKLISDHLDLAEMHIMYQLNTREEAMKNARKIAVDTGWKEENKEKYERNRNKYYLLVGALKPKGIKEYLSEIMRK